MCLFSFILWGIHILHIDNQIIFPEIAMKIEKKA